MNKNRCGAGWIAQFLVAVKSIVLTVHLDAQRVRVCTATKEFMP